MIPRLKCYNCAASATSREHVPPRSFFPSEYRANLWTVPSCDAHNLDQSADVEYVRSVIAMDVHTNDLARSIVAGPVRRSWLRRPRLLRRTFRHWRPILLGGQPSGVVEVDTARFDRVIGLIASAVYFLDTGQNWPRDWLVYSATMIASRVAFADERDRHNPALRASLARIPFVRHMVPLPRVFECASYEDAKGDVMYRFVFYEGAVTYAVPTAVLA